MLAFFAILLAVISRILPHALHVTAWNFTALGGSLLFFGSRLGSRPGSNPRRTALQLIVAVAVLMATDFYLTVYAYGFAFHPTHYFITWMWYAAVCLLGMEALAKPSVVRVALGVLASSTSFFLISNLSVWTGSHGHLYPRTLMGLAACYTAGLPFYRNDLVSTALTAGALFGLPVLAAKIAETFHPAQDSNLPAA